MNDHSFYDYLLTILKKDSRFLDEDGDIIRNAVIDKALKYDEELLSSLLEDKKLKDVFFKDVNGSTVFLQNLFIDYIQDKNFLIDSYTKYKNKIGLTIDGKYLNERNEVSLVWPFKDGVLEGGQTKEEQKRKEIFFNEVLAKDEIDRLFEPKVLTNFKRYTKDGEEKVTEIKRDSEGTIRENIIMKGNNLLALHSLKKEFTGKIKLIYIDPPYNTGTDSFGYNDNFNHSTWLTFMKNRFKIAQKLLRDDGVIFVQCDDNEKPYLKVLMDEIFGVNNDQVTLFIQVRYEGKSLTEKNDYQKLIEQIFVYSNGSFFPNKDSEAYTTEKFCWSIEELEEGEKIKLGNRQVTIFKEGQYKISKDEESGKGLKETWASGTVLKNNASGKFFADYIEGRDKIDGLKTLYKVEGIGEDGLGYRYFTGPKREDATKGKFYSGIPLNRQEELENGDAVKYKSISNFYNMADAFGNCRHEGGVELRSGKKPEILLKRVIEIATQEGDIVLDYHLGTGTTCAVAHKMKRQYIGIEQLDYGKNDSTIRLKNVINGDTTGISKTVGWKGGGSFIYCELKKYNEEFIERIEKAKDTKELLVIWEDMKDKSFLNYNVDIKKQEQAIDEFKALSLEKQKKALIELLDKNMLYVPLSDIDDEDFKVSEEDKKMNKQFYGQ